MRENSGIPGLVLLKCFYEYQKTVDEHTKLVLRREINRADYLEESWAQFMMVSEEASANGRRGRRARNMNGLDDDAGGIRRRGRGGLCAIM
jgi:F-box/leucine-rich repeat protein 2/20